MTARTVRRRFASPRSPEVKQKLVELSVEGVAVDQQSRPLVVLKDKAGDRRVDIWIGPAEAVAISMELEQRHPPRPMTHDLVRNILGELGVAVERLIINDVHDNTYFAQLVLARDDEHKDIDCRPSDGIAIALRAGAAIFMPDDLLTRIDQERQAVEAERKARDGTFIVDSGETVH